MNVTLVRANTNLVPTTQMISRTPAEFDGTDFPLQKSEEMTSSAITREENGPKVLIVSGNSFVSDFLRGLVEAHGYETQEVSDFHEAQVQVENGWPDVVFIDDSCLEIEHSKNFELRTQSLFQKGVPVILLANEQTKQQVERIQTMKFFQVVEKPVGYLQIGQVMADLTNV